jgi:NAD(P)-dependent dehydrogenase (short-subunit alcohol dehydrogenase family)
MAIIKENARVIAIARNQEKLEKIEKEIPVGKMGDPDKFASFALWLLSPLSEYVTGQVFTLDGGLVRYTL